YGYYVGLPDFTANNGPSGAYSPIFNAMAAAPRDSVPLGPTYGGYEYSISRFGHGAMNVSSANPGFTTGYGETPGLHGGGYRSAYVPPASPGAAGVDPNPGFT